jgi:hypothetical protein
MSSVRTITIAIAMIVLAVAVPSPARAQSRNGSIQGRVTDSSGAVLQGARVTVAPSGANAVTDANGEFVVLGLAPGDYTVTVTFVGFIEFSRKVSVAAGQSSQADSRLDVAGQSESIRDGRAAQRRGRADQPERLADNIAGAFRRGHHEFAERERRRRVAWPTAERHARAR